MDALALHEFHEGLHARFTEVSGKEVVADYGDVLAEYHALRETAGVIDLSFRSRLCALGADRQKFINGQVTNNVQALKTGEGCYAALVTAKGRIQSDLNVYSLANEILLDFEPGLADAIKDRLEKYVIADDVQMVDVAPHYGLLSVQGPKAAGAVESLQLGLTIPTKPFTLTSVQDGNLGEIYVINQPRLGTIGFDLFVPAGAIAAVADKAIAAAKLVGGRACGWQAFEIARIEAGIPRFGVDMDETNLAPEAIENRAISYSKGCYIGQEVIARIRTYGQVAKSLRGLRLADDLKALPLKGDKLFKNDKEVGYITSATHSPHLNA
ncbi:MAG: CAF17-like 4Fe-4S cluster assembly/insertion protein YgfZ, partial [Limisphaerales bacterium]